jgi:tRNA pseudouridine38-40 synthase
MPRRAFRLAYDGRPYHGFQRQPSVPTVEDALFDALRDLDVLDTDADKPTGYAAAGRTDAGVSAVGQVVAFDAPDWLAPPALNGGLPAAVRAWAHADPGPEFHATYDCTARAYRYHLLAPDADRERARTVADAVVGTHDLHNLTDDDGDTVRTVHAATVARDGDYLVLDVRAEGFLHNLVRRLAALVRAVATGAAPESKVERVLSPEPLPGPEGVPVAPAGPLVFVDATYPGVSFERDPEAAASAREVFGERAATARTRSRALGTVLQSVEDGVEDA